MAIVKGRPATVREAHIPAPTGGVNTVSPGLAMPLTDCVQAYNLVAADSGLRTRLGYREFSVNLPGTVDSGKGVRTVLPFTGSSVSTSRLFVATATGIHDVTGGAYVTQIAFQSTAGLAGYGTCLSFVTPGGRYLVYTDEVNGLYVYSESSVSWSKVTQGSAGNQVQGVDPGRFAHVALFKGRLYFTERETSTAWYLPANQIYGGATAFPLGQAFREGGTLVGLWNWTYDGGAGLDDSLVAISAGGDVVVYQGTDPASASTFSQRGVWQMSRPPAGRRIASTYGGDLLLLSRRGLLPLSQLVLGGQSELKYTTEKVANLVASLMTDRSQEPYWGVVLQPQDNVLMVMTPRANTGVDLQLVQAGASKGWFIYRNLPILSGAVWLGDFYFGTQDGRVCIHTGYADNVSLTNPVTFSPVDWGFVGAFSNMGAARQKRVSLMRPIIISDGANPSYAIQARYDCDVTGIDVSALITLPSSSAWDSVVWNQFEWAGVNPPLLMPSGAVGMGSSVAVCMRGQSLGRTVIVGVDVAWQQGGFL